MIDLMSAGRIDSCCGASLTDVLLAFNYKSPFLEIIDHDFSPE